MKRLQSERARGKYELTHFGQIGNAVIPTRAPGSPSL